jgi:hypothetical protein
MNLVEVASARRALLDFPFSERFSGAEQRTHSGEVFLAFFWFWSSLFVLAFLSPLSTFHCAQDRNWFSTKVVA